MLRVVSSSQIGYGSVLSCWTPSVVFSSIYVCVLEEGCRYVSAHSFEKVNGVEQLLWVTVAYCVGIARPCLDVFVEVGVGRKAGSGSMLLNEFSLFLRKLRTLVASVKSGTHCLRYRVSSQSFFFFVSHLKVEYAPPLEKSHQTTVTTFPEL